MNLQISSRAGERESFFGEYLIAKSFTRRDLLINIIVGPILFFIFLVDTVVVYNIK